MASFLLVLTTVGCSEDSLDYDEILAADPGSEALPPISDLIGGTSGQDAEEAFARFQLRVGELVLDCMATQGFEFYPDALRIGAVVTGAVPQPLTREEAEQIGLGVSVVNDVQQSTAPTVDANFEYLQSLDEAQQAAYLNALQGENGCLTGAERAAEVGEDSDQTFFEEFGDELGALEQRILTDPRIVGAESDWVECLRSDGYEYSSVDEIIDDISLRLEDAGWFDSNESDIKEIQAFERRVAGVVWSCDQRLQGVYRVVRFELEQEFIADNRSRLGRYPD